MTLVTPTQGGGGEGTFYTHLMDNDLNEINTWIHPYGPASMPYLNSDSTLIYPYRVPNPTMSVGGVGGGISIYSWDGDLLWDYEVSDENFQHHHDVEPLPNGNILVIAWEKKTASEAYAAGRQSIDNSLNEMWATAILELEPVGNNEANIVWEWHIWDHLIQDADFPQDFMMKYILLIIAQLLRRQLDIQEEIQVWEEIFYTDGEIRMSMEEGLI